MHIEDATGIALKDCEINSSGFYGLTITDTDVDITGGRVSNSLDIGVSLSSSDSDIEVLKVWDNGDASDEYGIYCYNGSTPDLAGGGNESNSNNFSNNEGEDIYATSASDDIIASSNFWNDMPDVHHENGSKSIFTSGETVYKPALHTTLAEANMLNKTGREVAKSGDYSQALLHFKQVVNDYPETETASFALYHASGTLWRQKDFENAVHYLDAIAQKHAGRELGRKAEYFSLRHLVKLGRYNEVISRADAFLNLYPESSQAPQVMLRKGRVLMWQLEKPDEAKNTFQQVIETYGDQRHPRQMAQIYLSIMEQVGNTTQFAQTQEDTEEPETQELGNYPNPFNPATTITFSLTEGGPVDLVIYNTLGQKVRTLIANATLKSGNHQILWDGKNEAGLAVSSGVYLYEMRAGDHVATRKMIMLK